MPRSDRQRLAQIISDTRTRTIVDETMTDVWLDEPVPAPTAASMTTRRGSGDDDRLDVEVVLGRPAHRLDSRGARHIGDHRDGASVRRHGHADRRTARRCVLLVKPTTSYRSGAKFYVLGATVLSRLLAASSGLPPDPGCGGMALWVQLPSPMSSALSAAALALGLDVPPGPRFGVDGTLERFVRIPYTLPDDRWPRRSNCWRARGAASPGRRRPNPARSSSSLSSVRRHGR